MNCAGGGLREKTRDTGLKEASQGPPLPRLAWARPVEGLGPRYNPACSGRWKGHLGATLRAKWSIGPSRNQHPGKKRRGPRTRRK